MPCNEFAPDVYNLYVLGLLDDAQRMSLDAHIEQNCVDCIREVQRSMNLWLVFSETLEEAEPSADFKDRLLRITELSKKVLTFPKASAEHRSHGTRWWMAAALAAVMMAATGTLAWQAGLRSRDLGQERLKTELARLNDQVASTQLELQQVSSNRQDLERAVTSSGKTALVDEQRRMQKQLLEWQASADQYKAVIERQQHMMEQNMQLIAALSAPGVHLIPMKGVESAAASTAYALVVEKSKLMVIAANLPKLASDKQFQLWLIRRDEPKIVSGGVFTPDDDNRAILKYDDSTMISEISAVAITDEPQGGSATPTGIKLLVASNGPPVEPEETTARSEKN